MANVVNHGQVLQALTTSGIINKGITVDQLTAASQQIASFIGDKVADWTFVSPNYVYKGSDIAGVVVSQEAQANVFKSLTANGIINKAITLEQIVDASQRVSALGVAAAKGDWTFISHNYVYKGSNVAAGDIATHIAGR
ncbi:MAG TPA: hypothetical protein VFT64_07285 [Rickettsiales bacterium]|nr:hypothetical protein [Rickettsiales bacterium]